MKFIYSLLNSKIHFIFCVRTKRKSVNFKMITIMHLIKPSS